MSGDAVKAYMYLLCESWLEEPRASLPNDDNELSFLAKLSLESWMVIKESVLSNFILIDGRWYNKKLKDISGSQEKFSTIGKMGGNPNFQKGKPNPYYQKDNSEGVIFCKNDNSDNSKDNPNQKDNLTLIQKDNPQDKGRDNLASASASSSASDTSPLKKKKGFEKPTILEIEEYSKSIGFKLDGQYFLDYQDARDWKMKGGLQVKDWKAVIRTWKRLKEQRSPSSNSMPTGADALKAAQGL